MTTTGCSNTLALAFALALPIAAAAQHEGHQTAGQMPGQGQATSAAACQVGAQQALGVLNSLTVGLERARLNDDPADTRAAMDALQAAVGELKIRLDACRPGGQQMPGMSGQPPAMNHSQMNMVAPPPGTPAMQPGSTQPAPGAPANRNQQPQTRMSGMDHSKMAQPAKPSGGTAAMAGMDHSKVGHGTPAADATMPADATDPVCGMKPSARHKAEYKGQTYYFCSETDRQKFLAAPEKYLKKE